MAAWRMSFRCGNQGYEMWPHCLELGVAAITYRPLAKVDLSKYPKGEPKKLWAQLKPSQHASLSRVVYEMRRDDIIYVKQGPKIVSKGIVTGSYQFDSQFRLACPYPDASPWSHQVPVDWELDFPAIDVLLGSEPTTVLPLSNERLRKIESAVLSIRKFDREQEALEGERNRTEATFRRRNRALIEAKKANSNGRCEVCEFSFNERYGSIGKEGKDYLVAHHINPLGQRSGPSKTSLSDIALLCPNCHAMVHAQNPPIPLEDLRRVLSRS